MRVAPGSAVEVSKGVSLIPLSDGAGVAAAQWDGGRKTGRVV